MLLTPHTSKVAALPKKINYGILLEYWTKYFFSLCKLGWLKSWHKMAEKKNRLTWCLVRSIYICILFLNLKFFPICLWNRFISGGLEPDLSHTKKLCMASNYSKFSTNIKIIIISLIPVLLAWAFGDHKTGNFLKFWEKCFY